MTLLSPLTATTSPTGVRVAAVAMRTRFEIVLYDDDAPTSDLRAAGEEALEEIAQVESWLSIYRDDSLLYQVNRSAANRPVGVDSRLYAFLQTLYELSLATDGAFDPSVGPLVSLWREVGTEGRIPAAMEIMTVLQSTGMAKILRLNPDQGTVSFTTKGAGLDPGAIGKGYALDRAADLLRDAGIRSALLHGGSSSVVAIGHPPGIETGWSIAIQHPGAPDAHLARVMLRDSALGVSAVHGRTFYAEGRTFGHVLDPRTGQPVADSLLAVCQHPSATYADALSTGLLVHGIVGLPLLTERFPEATWLIATGDEACNAKIAMAGSLTDSNGISNKISVIHPVV